MKDDENNLESSLGLGLLLDIISGRKDVAYLRYLLLILISVNLLIWVLVFFFSPQIYGMIQYNLDNSVPVGGSYDADSDWGPMVMFLVIGLPFCLGFLIAFCIVTLLQPGVEASRKIDSEIMAGYSYISNEGQHTRKLLISGAGGAINVIALAIAVLARS